MIKFSEAAIEKFYEIVTVTREGIVENLEFGIYAALRETGQKFIEIDASCLEEFHASATVTQEGVIENLTNALNSCVDKAYSNIELNVQGGLLYKLTNDRLPQNCEEIRVTMVNGSRDENLCHNKALQIKKALEALPFPSIHQMEIKGWFAAMADAYHGMTGPSADHTKKKIHEIRDQLLQSGKGAGSYEGASEFFEKVLAYDQANQKARSLGFDDVESALQSMETSTENTRSSPKNV